MGFEDPLVEVSLENLKIGACTVFDPADPAFVLEPEFRPKTKYNDFFESPTDQIPTIDLMPLRQKDEAGIQKVVDEIGKAAEEWGFFQVVNHGVPLNLVDTLKEEALAFFLQPLEEKIKVKRTLQQPLGYFHQELTKNHRDWKEVFDFLLREATLYKTDGGTSEYWIRNQWPERSPGLRDAGQKYGKATEALAFELLGLISRSLGLPEQYFHKYFVNHTSPVRLNYYPACPISDVALGVSRHRDPGVLTVLVQDETGGLQVRRKDGEWIGVKPRRDAFVINLGDVFQVWSNNKYRSIEHQVVVNENKARLSFPMFLNPATITEVSPVPELLDDEHPPRYRNYNYGSFMRKRTDGNFHQDGKNIQIDDFAIKYD